MVACAGVLVALWLGALTVVDLREMRLPNALTLPGAAVVLTVAAGCGRGLPALARRIGTQAAAATPGSYSARLLSDAALLRSKLTEEAGELAAAASAVEVTHEAADVPLNGFHRRPRAAQAGVHAERLGQALAAEQFAGKVGRVYRAIGMQQHEIAGG